ncbi:uncharacterized protein LOC111345717 [Stylophora pistillata]|uniref:uncharacterized protein LOC111345717 n=1 Tax=Stylophora pistillata TaxID=50429 RepID=UPI000C04E0A0|nr:uncharacterized protein LOC111345717 [Stylophora pistillata]
MHSTNPNLEEQVNQLATRPTPPRRGNCGWCGGLRHPRKDCPATKPGTYCTNCYMTENHLAKVCRSPKDKFKLDFEKKQRKQTKRPPPRRSDTAHHFSQGNDATATYFEDDDDDDYVVHSFSAFSLCDDKEDDKYFTWLPVSVSPDKNIKVLMQVDSAASCTTLPSSVFRKLSATAPLRPSHVKIFPYSGEPIRPLGKVSLACEGVSHFETLEFQVIDSAYIPGKPALISGRDSKRLGLLRFHKYRVFSSPTSDVKLPRIHLASSDQTTPLQSAATTDLQPGHLQQTQLVTLYKDSFEGLGNVGQTVHLTLDPKVMPCHAGIHRVPVAKLEKVKAQLDAMVKCGKLKKVDQPTNSCTNMTVREKTRPNGTTKISLCLDPSQTLNKAIIIPRYQIPTVQEILPRLSRKKHKTFSIFDALDGFTQVTLTDESSLLTTMHTPWGRYCWLRLPYGVSCTPEEFQLRMHEALEGLHDVYCIADDILVVGQGDTVEEANRNHDLNVLALMKRARDKNLKFNPQKIQFKLSKIAFMGHVISNLGVTPDPNKVKAISAMPAPTDKQGVMRFCGMTYTRNDLPKQSISCLAYFAKNKPVTLQVDASQGGLGGALLQPNDSGDLQPVAYTSCTLRPNEELWAQIEKECLAIVSACDKWDLWSYGREVNVHRDHQPLETIFKKPLHSAPRRLQKMLMRLQRYKIRVTYKKGTSLMLADTLSRAPLPTINDSKQTNFEIFSLDIDSDIKNPRVTSETLKEIIAATESDPTLCHLIRVITTGWPSRKSELTHSLHPYWNFREELTHQDGNAKEPMKSQPIPEYPWQFISRDICAFESSTYLATTDHYSDFIEVDELEDILSATIVAKTEAHFARHGVPETILTDNGPQFIASDFEQLCHRYQTNHVTSSPYWPKGNGKLEASVKIVKRILKKSGKTGLHEAHLLSPAERSTGRRTRGLLPISTELLLPSDHTTDIVQGAIAAKRARAKQHCDKVVVG